MRSCGLQDNYGSVVRTSPLTSRNLILEHVFNLFLLHSQQGVTSDRHCLCRGGEHVQFGKARLSIGLFYSPVTVMYVF